ADALRTWDASLADGDGRFYEFEYAPEQEVRAVSEHVEVWRPSVRFHYSHTSKGPAALLAFGDDTVLYQYEMKRREEVEDLMTLLRAAVQGGGGWGACGRPPATTTGRPYLGTTGQKKGAAPGGAALPLETWDSVDVGANCWCGPGRVDTVSVGQGCRGHSPEAAEVTP